jgi:hypothetical protein
MSDWIIDHIPTKKTKEKVLQSINNSQHLYSFYLGMGSPRSFPQPIAIATKRKQDTLRQMRNDTIFFGESGSLYMRGTLQILYYNVTIHYHFYWFLFYSHWLSKRKGCPSPRIVSESQFAFDLSYPFSKLIFLLIFYSFCLKKTLNLFCVHNQREVARGCKRIVDMDGVTTYLTHPTDQADRKSFSFDHSYWSFDGFNEDKNVADPSHPRGHQYCDQVNYTRFFIRY